MVICNRLQGRSIVSHNQEHTAMSAHIYKKLEIVGSSPTSIEEAVNNAVAKAAETIRHIRWVELVETRCHVEEQKIAYWQVTCKIGFTLDEK
jgi:dodecin